MRKGVLNSFALRIEHRFFWRNDDFSLHAPMKFTRDKLSGELESTGQVSQLKSGRYCFRPFKTVP
jgi:hypothetical protein